MTEASKKGESVMDQDTRQFDPVGEPTTPQPVGGPATPPPAARTNRAWMIAAIVLGVLLLAAVVFILARPAAVPERTAGSNAPSVATTRTPTEAGTTETATDENEEEADSGDSESTDSGSDADGTDESTDGDSEEPPEPPQPIMHPLEGTLWDVQVIGDGMGNLYDIHPSYSHQVEFSDGAVHSIGTVNTASAPYSISGDEDHGWGPDFMCGDMMTTLMLGPPEAMAQEALINEAIEASRYFEIQDNWLYLKDESGETLLICDIVPGD
ncbi:MAG: hypothetical protein Kow0056_08330 [Coriobacteriia bacterium]